MEGRGVHEDDEVISSSQKKGMGERRGGMKRGGRKGGRGSGVISVTKWS